MAPKLHRTAHIILSRRLIAVFALAIAVYFAAGRPAPAAGEFAACVRNAADADLVATTRFQEALHDLIVQQRPEFAALAALNRELQIALAEAQRTRLEYLLALDPGRIDTASGRSRFANFDWSETDTARLAETDRSYAELENRIAALRGRNDGHPDWPDMRAFFQSGLARSPEFAALTKRFQARQRDVEARIAQCKPD